MVDIRQSKCYANYLETQGWIVERINNTNYFIKKIPIVGSVLKLQRPKIIDFKTIQKLQNNYKVFQTIIEPNLGSGIRSRVHALFISNGYKLSKHPYLPTKTLQIDLKKSITQITADFKKETRRCIRIGEKIKIKRYSTPDELKVFQKAWRKSVKISRFVPSCESLINLSKSFHHNHSLILASHNISGEIIGGGVFTRSGTDLSYYWYGFTNKEGRTSLSQYSLLYQSILWGKKSGCKFFDMEGVYDSRFPNKSWVGFSKFKRSFGGKEVLYPGCYTKYNLT